MKITFHYVRHGETLFNVLDRMQGWCDSPLTQHGIQQALEARQQLLPITLNRAFSSTSERCIDTANIILSGSGPGGKKRAASQISPSSHSPSPQRT